jgi:hypothetical protein
MQISAIGKAKAKGLAIGEEPLEAYQCARFLCHPRNRGLVMLRGHMTHVQNTVMECAEALAANGTVDRIVVVCGSPASRDLWKMCNAEGYKKDHLKDMLVVTLYDFALRLKSKGRFGVSDRDMLVLSDWYSCEISRDLKTVYDAMLAAGKIVCVVLECMTKNGIRLLDGAIKGVPMQTAARTSQVSLPVSRVEHDDRSYLLPFSGVPDKGASMTTWIHKNEEGTKTVTVREARNGPAVNTRVRFGTAGDDEVETGTCDQVLTRSIQTIPMHPRRVVVVVDKVDKSKFREDGFDERSKEFIELAMSLRRAVFFIRRDTPLEDRIRINEKFRTVPKAAYLFVEKSTDSYVDDLRGASHVFFPDPTDETVFMRTLTSVLWSRRSKDEVTVCFDRISNEDRTVDRKADRRFRDKDNINVKIK